MTTLLRKLSWDSDTDERVDLGLEDGTQMKVQVGMVYDISLFYEYCRLGTQIPRMASI